MFAYKYRAHLQYILDNSFLKMRFFLDRRQQRAEENYIIRNVIVCTLHQTLLLLLNKESLDGRFIHYTVEKCIENFKKNPLTLVADGRM
jgi:hypothetical protein